MSNLGDYYFIKELLDRETALSHNGETGYYSVNANFFGSGWAFPESEYSYSFYNAMRAVFRSNYDYSSDSGFNNHESLNFFTFSGDDNLYYCFHNTPNIRGNLSNNQYYEVQFNPQQSSKNIYKYDTTTNEISVYSTMSSGSSYKSVPVYKFLASTGSLYVWGTSTNTNYINIEGNSGNSSGGWQVPNPNPTHKIVINGSEPDNIKLNGATPLKIMLNGVCYYERQSSTYLHNWDLTSGTADSVGGTELQYYTSSSSDTTANVANKSGLYTSGTGVTLADQNDVNGIVLPINLYTPGNVLEVDFTNFQVTYTMMDWGQTMVQTHKCQNSYNTDYGIHCGVDGGWFLTSNYDLGSGNTSYGYCSITNSTQAQLFANSTLKIKVISSANNRTQWEIYKDDTLLATTPELNNSSTYPFMLANASDTDNLFMLSPNYLNATVTGIRIYQE